MQSPSPQPGVIRLPLVCMGQADPSSVQYQFWRPWRDHHPERAACPWHIGPRLVAALRSCWAVPWVPLVSWTALSTCHRQGVMGPQHIWCGVERKKALADWDVSGEKQSSPERTAGCSLLHCIDCIVLWDLVIWLHPQRGALHWWIFSFGLRSLWVIWHYL